MSRIRVVSLCLFAVGQCIGASAQTPAPTVFASRVDFGTGANPTRFDIGDVNGDGDLDIVTANFYTNTTVSVLLGNGDGTFDPHQEYEVGFVPYAVKIADLNHDGRPDLAATNREPGTVSILLGNGDGTFQPRTAYPAGAGPVTLAVADLNGDGHPDLAVGALVSGAAAILLGNGDGTFQSPVLYPTGFFTYSLIAADFNADSNIDVATANLLANTVSVLLGNGDGSFQPGTDYSAGGPIGLVAADFDQDGRLDLAATLSTTNSALILKGNGDGTFGLPASYDLGPTPAFMESVGDMNGDGRLDLVVPNQGNGTVSVLPARADGTFGPAEHFAVGSVPISAGSADLDGDGRSDVVVTNNAGHTVTILLGGSGDTTPPIITLQSRTASNAAGWNSTDVVIAWTCSDVGGAGVVSANVTHTVTTEGANQSATGTCTDLAGNTATDTQSGINIDKTPPTLAPVIGPLSVFLNGSATAAAGAVDALSGLATAGCAPLLTDSVGSKSVTCTATDTAGNSSSQSVPYQVVFRFDGFLQPINDTAHAQVCGSPCPISVFRGGSTVPVKFQLTDANGVVVESATPPQWELPVLVGVMTDFIDEIVNNDPATSGAHYRWTDPNYIFNWSTKNVATGHFWRIGVTLEDGRTYFAYIGLR